MTVTFAVVLSLGISCGDDSGLKEPARPSVPASQSPPPDLAATEVTVNDVFEDIHAFVGRPAVMTGEVVAVLTEKAFTFREETDAGSQAMLVVRAGEDGAEGLAPGDFVWLHGVIRDFDIKEIEVSAQVELAEAPLEQFNDEPVLVAEETMSGNYSVGAIVSAAEPFAGRTVRVTASVGQILNSQALILESADGFLGLGQDSLLVVGDASAFPGQIEETTIVSIQGTVHIVRLDDPGGLVDDFPFLSEDLAFELFDDDPVLVVDSLEIVEPAG